MDYVNRHWRYCGDQWPLNCIWRHQHIHRRKCAGWSLFATVLENIDHNANNYCKAWQNYMNARIPFANYHQIFDTADHGDISVSHAALMFFSGTAMILTWKRTSWYSQHEPETDWNSIPKKNRSLRCNFITSLSSSWVCFMVTALVRENLNVGLSNKSKCNDFVKLKYGGIKQVNEPCVCSINLFKNLFYD